MMAHALTLHLMVPGLLLEGTTLAKEALSNSEIAQRIKEAMEPLRDDAGAALDFIYLVSGHPPMRPEQGYVVLISFPFSCLLFN